MRAWFTAVVVAPVLVAGVLGSGCPSPGAGTGRADSRGVVSGRVVLTDIDGLNDMSRVRVDLGRGEGGITPETDGTFVTSDLEPDVYALNVTYVGGLTPTASRSAYIKLSTRAVVRAGSSVNVGDLVLQRATGTVRGKVMKTGDVPVQDAEVTLSVLRGDQRRVSSAADGAFEFSGVPVGTHALNVAATTLARSAAGGACSPQVVVQQADDVVDMQDVALAPTDVSIIPGSANIRDTVGPRWLLDTSMVDPANINDPLPVTANVFAPFARQWRVWNASSEGTAGTIPPFVDVPSNRGIELTATEGETAWNFEFSDGCGFQSPRYVITLVKDVTPPDLLDLTVDNGAAFTRASTANVLVNAVDVGGGLTLKLLACADTLRTEEQCTTDLDALMGVPLDTALVLPLPDEQGLIRVMARVLDAAGNRSGVAVRTLVRDTVPPVLDSVKVQGVELKVATGGMEREALVTDTEVRPEVAVTGAARVVWGRDTEVDDVAPWAVGTPVDLRVPDVEGAYTVVFRAWDAAGNPAEEVRGTLRLVNTGSIHGTAQLDRGGNALGVTVVLTGSGGRSAMGTVGADGTYAITGIRAGRYVVTVNPPTALASRYRPLVLGERQVDANADRAMEQALLRLRTGSAQGVVKLGDLDAATGAHEGTLVVATNVDQTSEAYTAITGPTGAWSLDLPVGTFSFSAQARGYGSAVLGQRTVEEGAVVTIPQSALSRATGDFQINGGAPFTRSTLVTVNVAVPQDVTRWRLKDGAASASADPFVNIPTDRGFTLNAGDGPHTVHLQFEVNGGAGPDLQSTIILDQTPPAPAAVAIHGGAEFTADALGSVSVSIPDSDVTSGVSVVFWNTVNDRMGAQSLPYAAVVDGLRVGTPSTDGLKTLYLWLQDRAGNETATPLQDSIFADRTAPAQAAGTPVQVVGSVNGRVGSSIITLALDARDRCSAGYPRTCTPDQTGFVPAAQVMLSHFPTFSGASWQQYAPQLVWTLLPDDGVRTVYLRFRDEAGNVSADVPVQVTVDTSSPNGNTLTVAMGAPFTRVPNVTVRLDSPTATAYRLGASEDALNVPGTPTNATFPLDIAMFNLGSSNGIKMVVADFYDELGRSTRNRTFITLDSEPPVASIRLQPQGTTTTASIQAFLQASDSSGVEFYALSLAPITAAPTTAFSISALPVPTLIEGLRTVYARVSDRAGNTTDVSASILFDGSPPTAPSGVSVTPRAGRLPAAALSNGATTNDASPRVAWGASTDLPAQTPAVPPTYTVELSRRADFNALLDAELVRQTGLTVTSYSPPALADGAWNLRVSAVDGVGNTTPSSVFTFSVDGAAPAVPLVSAAAFVNSVGPLTLTFTTADTSTTGYQVTLTGDVASASTAAWAATRQVTLSSGDGTKVVRVSVADAVGNTATTTVSTVLDTRAPELGTPSVNGGSNAVTDAMGAAQLSIPCSDTGSGLASRGYRITKAAVGTGAYTTLSTLQAAYAVTFSAGEGSYVVDTICTDAAGNTTATPATITVVLDRTAPVFTLTAPATSRSTTVPVTVSNVSDVAQLAVSTVDIPNCSAGTVTYSTPPATGVVPFVLTDGTYTFYACARDRLGNTTAMRVASGSTVVDTVAPTFTATIPPSLNVLAVPITLATADVTTGYVVSVAPESGTTGTLDSSAFAIARTFTLATPATDGARAFTVVVTDAAGNTTRSPVLRTELDRAAPTIVSVTAPATVRGTRVAGVTANVTGATTMNAFEVALGAGCSAAPACGSAGYGPYYPSFPFTLSPALGGKGLCAAFCDAAGNRAVLGTSVGITLEAFDARPTPVLQGFTTAALGGAGVTPFELDAGTSGNLVVTSPSATFPSDLQVVIGLYTLQCGNLGGAGACSATNTAACGNTCDITLPLQVSQNPGEYEVRLNTPDPVVGGVNQSASVGILRVRSALPTLVRLDPRGVTNATSLLTGPTAVRVCAKDLQPNARFQLGINAGTVQCYRRAGYPDVGTCSSANTCPTDTNGVLADHAYAEVRVPLSGISPSAVNDQVFRLENPAPGGGVVEVPFGVVPTEVLCTTDQCRTDLRATRPRAPGGTGVAMGLGLGSNAWRAKLAWKGGTAARVLDASGGTLSRVLLDGTNGLLTAPLLSGADRVVVEDAQLTGAPVTLRATDTALNGNAPATAWNAVFPTANEERWLSADLNDDGVPDLVGIGSASAQVRVMCSPSYIVSLYDVAAGPESLALADLNVDGIPDLVVGHRAGQALVILEGAGGACAFSNRTELPVATFNMDGSKAGVRSLEVGDVNRDGLTDVVVGTVAPAGFGLQLLTYLGTFPYGLVSTTPVTSFVGSANYPEELRLVDLDRDGQLDALVAGGRGNPGISGELYVAKGQGNGAFAFAVAPSPFTYPGDAWNMRRPWLADFNGDGAVDVVTGAQPGSVPHNSVAVFLGDGRGGFASAVMVPLTRTVGVNGRDSLRTLAVLDVNVDGRPDLVGLAVHAGSDPSGDVTVMTARLANADGTFGPVVVVGTNPIGGALPLHEEAIVTDFATTGLPELLVGMSTGNVGVRVSLSSGLSFLGQTRTASLPGGLNYGVQAADLNGDLNVDLLVAGSGVLRVLSNTAPHSFSGSDITHASWTGVQFKRALELGDVNGDGYADAVMSGNGNYVAWASGTAASPYLVGQPGGPETCEFRDLRTLELNTDGFADVVATCADNTLAVRFGSSMGPAATQTVSLAAVTSVATRFLAVGDLDQDGRPDVVVSLEDGAVVVLKGNGSGLAAPARYAPPANLPPSRGFLYPRITQVAVADFDNDGVLDVQALNTQGALVFWKGLGNGALAAATTAYNPASPPPTASRATFVDLTGDHIPDALLTDSSTQQAWMSAADGRGGWGAFVPVSGWRTDTGDFSRYGPSPMVSFDVDRDGAPDALLVQTDTSEVTTFGIPPTPGETWELDPLSARPTALAASSTTQLSSRAAALFVDSVAVRVNLRSATTFAGTVLRLKTPSGQTVVLNDSSAAMGCQAGAPAGVTTDWLATFTSASSCEPLAPVRGFHPAGNWTLEVQTGPAVSVLDAALVLVGNAAPRVANSRDPSLPEDIRFAAGTAARHVRGTTVGGRAQDHFPLPTCGGVANQPMRAHRLTAPRSGTLTALAVADFDAVMELRAGSCSGMAVQCQDDTVGRNPQVSGAVTAGQQYCLLVTGYSSSRKAGPYDLFVRIP